MFGPQHYKNPPVSFFSLLFRQTCAKKRFLGGQERASLLLLGLHGGNLGQQCGARKRLGDELVTPVSSGTGNVVLVGGHHHNLKTTTGDEGKEKRKSEKLQKQDTLVAREAQQRTCRVPSGQCSRGGLSRRTFLASSHLPKPATHFPLHATLSILPRPWPPPDTCVRRQTTTREARGPLPRHPPPLTRLGCRLPQPPLPRHSSPTLSLVVRVSPRALYTTFFFFCSVSLRSDRLFCDVGADRWDDIRVAMPVCRTFAERRSDSGV